MFREIRDIAVERFGVDGEVARHLNAEIAVMEVGLEGAAKIVDAPTPREGQKVSEVQFEKGAVLFIAVGAVVLIALMGFSSMLIAMMAIK